MKNRVVLSALVCVAFIISGCADPVPTELPADGTLSATAAPKKSVPVIAVMDLSGPTPGLPNIINPECITVDTGTLTAHFKNCIVVGTSAGDLTGDVTAILNGWQSLVDLSAVAHGHLSPFDVCHVDLGCGAFEGPFKGEAPPGGQATLRGNAHGTGDFHTLQARLTAVERGNTAIYDVDGVIF